MSDDKKQPAPVSPEFSAMQTFFEGLLERMNPSLQAQIAMSKREMEAIRFPEAPPEMVPVRIPCVHPNGYRFTALVAPSETFQYGRWVGIEDERWPTDEELCATIDWWHKRNRWKDPSNPSAGYDPDTQLWLYDNIRLPILRAVGGELPVDWREDMQERVQRLRELAAKEQAKLTEELRKIQMSKPPEPPQAGARTPRMPAAPALDPK